MKPTKTAGGFTLIELLTVISIIALLASMMFPVFSRAREKARGISCLSNMKQIGLAVTLYAQDYDGVNTTNTCHFDEIMPDGISTSYYECGLWLWHHNLHPYIKSVKVFTCPSWLGSPYTGRYECPAGYGAGFWLGVPDAEISRSHSEIIAVVETIDGYYLADWDTRLGEPFDNRSPVYGRHNGMATVSFLDGHAKAMRADKISYPEDGQHYPAPPTDLWSLN